jgi:type I restriction enzyme S subunit
VNKTNTGLSDLPKGWVWTTLEEISEIILGQSPPSSTYNTDGEGLPFYQGKLEFGKLYPTPRKWCTAPKKIAEKGDVFISIRAPVGPTNICPEKSAVGRGLAAIRGLGGIESFFILYLMRAYANEIASRGTGTTFDAITGNQLKTFEILLPPLAEQRRIAAKLEVLFTQLDTAVDSLKKAQAQLQRYRRSILKAAFEGELTRKWREGYSSELEPMSVSEISTPNSLPKLPDGWVWTTLEEISEIVLGQSPPSSTYNTDGEGLPFYQGKLEFGKLYPTPRKWCTKPKKIAQKGDVFISIRAPVGPTNICPEKSAVGRGLAAIRGLNGIQPSFILFLMRRFENEIASRGTGTTFKAITGNQLKSFQIPLPPLVEQEYIISELERCFSIADEVKATIASELTRVERLRQSILKQAFSGKLVSQDPNDEPAEALLARIKAEH